MGYLLLLAATRKGKGNELPEIATADDWSSIAHIVPSRMRDFCNHTQNSDSNIYAQAANSNIYTQAANSDIHAKVVNADIYSSDSNSHAYHHTPNTDTYAHSCAANTDTSPAYVDEYTKRDSDSYANASSAYVDEYSNCDTYLHAATTANIYSGHSAEWRAG